MRRLRAALMIGVTVVATWWVTGPTMAQAPIPDGVFVRESNGAVWLVLGGQRIGLPVWAASDSDIAALPVGGQWAVMNDTGAMVAGARPAWFVEPAAPAVSVPVSDGSIAIGTPFTYDGWEILVEGGARDSALPKTSGPSAEIARPKGVFVNLAVKVTNLSSTSASAPRFQLLDDAGRRFDEDGFAGLYGGLKYKLPSGYITTVQPSVSDKVMIGFDIAADAKGLLLVPVKGPEPRPRWITGL